jgi:hypothetical protein
MKDWSDVHRALDHWEAHGAPVATGKEPVDPALCAIQDLAEPVYGCRPAAALLRAELATPQAPGLSTLSGVAQALALRPSLQSSRSARACQWLAQRRQGRLNQKRGDSPWNEPGLQTCIETGKGILLGWWGLGLGVTLLPLSEVAAPTWVLGLVGTLGLGLIGGAVKAFMTARGWKALRASPSAPPSRDPWLLFYGQTLTDAVQQAIHPASASSVDP